MKIPRVSVLLAVRNEQLHLPAALASIWRQSESSWELVAVDDGSCDATPSILRQAAERDPRVRLFCRPPLGLVNALNAGLSQCRADLVARMDGDDICHPRRLERQLAAFSADPDLDLVSCRVRQFPRPTLTQGMRHYETWQNSRLDHAEILRDLWVESPFAHPSVVYRRDLVQKLGGYRDCAWAEEYDLWLRLAAAGCRFARCPETLLFWRDRPERLTRTADNCSLEAFRACRIHHLQRGYLAGERGLTLWGAGVEGKAWRRALTAAGITVQRWVEIDPRKLGQTIHGAPVVGIDTLAPGQGKMLISVGTQGARAQVRSMASTRGLVEGVDFLCVT